MIMHNTTHTPRNLSPHRPARWTYAVTASLGLLALLLLMGTPATAQADEFKAWIAATLPASPEGLAFDSAGTLYTSLPGSGEIYRIGREGKSIKPEYIATVPSKADAGKGAALGMAFDADGSIVIAYFDLRSRYAPTEFKFYRHNMACKDATDVYSGVYRVNVKTGEVTPIATRASGWPFCLPDDVDVDSAGNIYMSDLTFSGIWKISADGSKVDLWSAHPLLNVSDEASSGALVGTNVLVINKDETAIYAGTDNDPSVVRVPILEDGSAGEAERVAAGFTPLDGVELDEVGNIYVSEPRSNEIRVLTPDGMRRRTVATAYTAPLVFPTSLAYWKGVLCTANYGPTTPTSPRTVVCMSGLPRP